MFPFELQLQKEKKEYQKPIVMGILNLTTDSFYDGGKYLDSYIEQVAKMLQEGATIIDVGAMSSKPGSPIITAEIEIQKLQEPIRILKQSFPEAIFSVDTLNSETAAFCLDQGVDIINDISASAIDSKMIQVIKNYPCTYIAMHMRGTPETMITLNQYDNMVEEILEYFKMKIAYLENEGVRQIIADVGFGFAKNIKQNFTLLKELNKFLVLHKPLLVGISRKSMIYKTLSIKPEEALNGTTSLHMLALQNGASILRVHDVKEAIECIALFEAYKQA
ncbi:MAG: dihydropteroate synthase [Bacteroidota bacterium]